MPGAFARPAGPPGTAVRSGSLLRFFGPAFIVSVAYMDPGNFGTNISGGSLFNYDLIWVVLASNLMAILVQILSAKLGIVTGANLPVWCGRLFTRRANWFLLVIATAAAMATDLAEFLGGALGFYLLFRIPLVWSGLLTGAVTFAMTGLEKYGHRKVELAIGSLVSVISVCYVIELFLAKPDWGRVAYHTVVPMLNRESIMVAVGMLGATVMPHVIYLHSQLVQPRREGNGDHIRLHLRNEKIDIIVAMNIAFVINAAMIVVSAAVFHSRGLTVVSIEQAHQTLAPLLGRLSSGAFGLALLASGLSSSTVGTMAGQVIMEGFVGLRTRVIWRRLLTMLPAMVVIGLGLEPMRVLVLSQVVLSFALPAAIVPLLIATGRRDVMGEHVNGPLTNALGWLIAGLIIALNALLLYMTITG
ncbi:MAG: Nramp family divalent metal transporter [Bacteroidota bacterium]